MSEGFRNIEALRAHVRQLEKEERIRIRELKKDVAFYLEQNEILRAQVSDYEAALREAAMQSHGSNARALASAVLAKYAEKGNGSQG